MCSTIQNYVQNSNKSTVLIHTNIHSTLLYYVIVHYCKIRYGTVDTNCKYNTIHVPSASTVLSNTHQVQVQYCACTVYMCQCVQYNTVQYSKIWDSAYYVQVQYCIYMYMYSTVQYSTVQYSTVQLVHCSSHLCTLYIHVHT